jgi:hypothetical protein
MWIPLVLVGSALYWTVALGLGGVSISLLGDNDAEDLALPPPAVTEPVSRVPGPILVHFEKRTPLTGAGGNTCQDDGTGRLPAIDEIPPPPEDSVGRTSY